MKAKLNGIIGIDNAMERKLGSIDTTKKFIEATRTSKGRELLSQNTGISVHDITYWATQAELLRVNNMNAEEAVELIDAGIYSVEQLQKANKEELLDIIDKKNDARNVKTVLTEEKLSQLQHEKVYATSPYEYDDIDSILHPEKKEQSNNTTPNSEPNMTTQTKEEKILTAKEIINKFNKEDGQKIDEGIKFLENIKPALPLPRTISGHVKIEDNNTISSTSTMSASGLLVSISGISNPAEDKEENEDDYSCYTDPDGNFTIAMPDKYNMQETITISVSKKNDMTYAIAGQSTSHKVEFVKLASEVLNNEYLYTVDGEKKKAAKILDSVNEISENSAKAKEIEKTLYKLAYCEYAKAEFENNKIEIIRAIEQYKSIISEEVDYHIANSNTEIGKKIIQYDDELRKINEAISLAMEQDKAIFGGVVVLALIAAIFNGIINLFSSTKNTTQSVKKAQKTAIKTNDPEALHIENTNLDIKNANEAFKKLKKHIEGINTKAPSITKSQKTLLENTKKIINQIDEQQNKQTTQITLRSQSAINEQSSTDNSSSSQNDLLTAFLELAQDLIALQDEYIAESQDFNQYKKIEHYENSFLPKYSKRIREYMTKIQELQPEENDNEIDKILCDTIEELQCDLSAYLEIKECYKKLERIKEIWTFLTKENTSTHNIESDHFYQALNSDPYENAINMFPNECELFKGKIDDYKNAKNALQKINDSLDYIEELKIEYEKNNITNSYYTRYTNKLKENIERKKASENDLPYIAPPNENDSQNIDEYAEKLYEQYDELITDCQEKLNALPRFNNIEDSQTIESSDMAAVNNCIQIERYLLNILSTPMDSEFEDDFIINQSDFEDTNLHPRALPSVKLMGDGKNEIYLPTDTAPSRMFNYTMVHRLVEPQLKKSGINSTRTKLNEALNIHSFKENLYNTQENLALASTLGIGYALNMHQAWVPDGFALGNLLYSLVLAPGEEQRLIVREHKEDYTVSDDANAIDRIHDSYSNSQVDNETAAFNNAVSRYSSAHSDSAYSSRATSFGKTKITIFHGIGASSSATSINSGSSFANSSQRDSYDEASHAAQSFQTSIKTESERIASANRTSIRVATSEESEAVSSRIVANHNHSHVMTVQYWEVARRYRLETCIDGIELLLFVPLELIRFMPDKYKNDAQKAFSEYTLKFNTGNNTENNTENNTGNNTENNKTTPITPYNKENFEYRYKNILKYYDTIEAYVPVRYRSGLNLIKKFAALPYWDVQKISSTTQKYSITIKGGFCEFDNLSATIYFSNGSRPVQGIQTLFNAPLLKTDKNHKNPHTRKEVEQAIINARKKKEGTADFTFALPYGCEAEDISQIKISNNIDYWKYTLSQSTSDMEEWEKEAVEHYEAKLEDLYEDDKSSGKDIAKIQHYAPGLPECYYNPVVSFSSWELHSLGDLEIDITEANKVIGSGTLGYNALNIYVDNSFPRLRLTDIQKIEETFHHIVSDTMYYSQVVWSSLSDDERIILLEPYTIEIDNFNRIASTENNIYNKTRSISLLNCVNAKKVVGFYGNCMMLPFTFPKELAELIGKTAGDIQDELYRYHACNFRVPSTVVSIPTDGMVGEAVLGATNVSEKIDITRFWNWKDSDIDHIDLNQSSLNGRSLLENASTREVNAPTVGVTPTEHINGNNLAAALIARQQPTFADVYQNTDMRDVMKNADNNASAGREQIIKTNAELTKAALDAAVKAGEAALTGGASGALGGAGGALSGSSLTGLVDTLGKLGFNDSDILKSITNGDGTIEGIFKAAAGLSKGSSGTSEGTIPSLTSALKSFGGKDLQQFLSNFANNATNGQSLEDSFKNSFSNISGTDKNVTINDILDMSNKFCSENNINLSDFTSALGKALGLF